MMIGLLLALAPSVPAHAAEPEIRPLLVILMEREDGTPLAYDEWHYAGLVFGGELPNVVDYFSAISRDRFTFESAGVIRVRDRTDSNFVDRAGGGEGTTATRLRALMLAHDAGFEFEDHDADGDGTVATEELGVLVIDNYSEGLGQTGTPPCVVHPDGTEVCTAVALTGHRSRFVNYAHELSHLVSTIDLYGASCHSLRATLMSCTASNSGSDGLETYHLDPWHRSWLGWDVSEVVIDPSTDGSATLAPMTRAGLGPGTEKVVLPRPRSDEYLIFEYRPDDEDYDGDVRPGGIMAWYVQESEDGRPINVESLTVEDGTDAAVFTLQPVDCVGDPMDPQSRGRIDRGYEPGSSYRFRWLDGSDTTLLVTFGEVAGDGTVDVTWERSLLLGDYSEAPRPQRSSSSTLCSVSSVAVPGGWALVTLLGLRRRRERGRQADSTPTS